MNIYYKVAPGSELHKKLKALSEKIDRVRAMAKMLAQTFGGSDYCPRRDEVAGGIDAVEFPHGQDPPKDSWKKVGKSYQRFFFPKASNKDALAQIIALPVMEIDEWNSPINFEPGFGSTENSLVHYQAYGMNDGTDGSFLIAIPAQLKYTPVAGMEEIKGSEYKELKVERK